MIFHETPLPGTRVIELEKHEDERGSFARAWCAREFAAQGLPDSVAQISLSVSRRSGTIRGMHWQREPHEEAKVVRCIRGRIYDVAVDVRPDSPDFGKWFGVELDAVSGRAFYVPRGFAHGFQTLEDDVELLYVISEFYAPDAQVGFHYADPEVGIAWPLEPGEVSARDRALPSLTQMRAALP